MATEIKAWQIVDNDLHLIDISMTEAGKKEVEHLEKWIKSNPAILGEGILVIGEQVRTKSGCIDFLAIDESGNLVVIELKRDKLSREVLAQAMDYASDVASWDEDKIGEVCLKFRKQEIEDYLNENLKNVNLADLAINETQRILLIGFSIDESLQRMIEWLSDNYGVSINAIILKYVQTKKGDELLARTMVISEEIAKEKTRKSRINIEMSDEPGVYSDEELASLLDKYLSEERPTPTRIREILLPLCMRSKIVTREMIKRELIEKESLSDEGKAGTILTTISREIGIKQRDYLRQIIQYDKASWAEKDNYRLVEKYSDLVRRIVGKEVVNTGANQGRTNTY